MKIYTKTGDGGTSSLFTGERRPKHDPTFDALGTIDELNAALGLALARVGPKDRRVVEVVTTAQSRLFDLGATVATPGLLKKKVDDTKITPEDVRELETAIDAIDAPLPPLRAFVLPGGANGGAELHCARAVCRRAERSVVALGVDVDTHSLKYLNRLSDFLFVAARSVDPGSEVHWRPRSGSPPASTRVESP